MNKEDKLVEQLVKIYTEALEALKKKITAKATLGRATAYERSLYRQVEEELDKLKKNSSEAVKKLVQHSYKKGLNSLLKDVEGVEKRNYNLFSGLNAGQIELIADNLTRDLNNAVNLIGRRYDDLIRKVTLETTAKKLSQGQTIRQMQKQLAEELQKNNINYVEYADGKRHGIKDYANMAARSTTAEAQNKAKIVQGEDWGYDLVRMTKHYPTCEICAMYQDRVYALTKEAANGKYKDKNGKSLRLPYLYDTAFADGYDTIHPNCRHLISIFPARAYTLDELAEFSRRSMQPFEDTRPDNERKAYAAEQATKRKRNASYRQYQDVKAHLPNDAPKTFAGWQRMKQTNSQRYQDLMADYRYVKKSVATSGDGGIINTQTFSENEELPRKDKNGDFSVKWSIIQSESYSDKFKQLSDDDRAVAAIETRAKWVLNNRDGLETEEIYAVNLSTGDEIARITDQQNAGAIQRTPEFTKKLNIADESCDRILLLHNHPKGLPPSISDINSLLGNVNIYGITVGHDGSLYYYTRPKEAINEIDYKVKLRHYKNLPEVDCIEAALMDLQEKFGFTLRKL